MRDRENIAACLDRDKWLPDRNKRARLSLHLKIFRWEVSTYSVRNVEIIDEKCWGIQRDVVLFKLLKNCRFFIKIDLTDVYNRIRIKNNEWKTTFHIRYEHFEYLMIFFDLANASITFQAYINKIFNKLINDFCVMYLNDILIFFKNRKSHVQHIREMLKRLRTNDFFANLEKCFFFQIWS
jgi:hypothetical protein